MKKSFGNTQDKRVLSGDRPTGNLHIGHLLGKLQNWIKLQKEYDCFYFIADYHALTTMTPPESKKIPQNTIEMVADWLACGIDPKKSTLFIQSKVPQHLELGWLLAMVTPISWLLRCPTFKEQARLYPENVNYGLLGYPVLQAADILIYKANYVPVGKDQIPHVEMTREIARTFNQRYGKTFPLPEVLLSKIPKVMGLDRPKEKMSKSFGPQNYLALSDSPKLIREKIQKAVTDLGPTKEKISPGVKNLFRLLEIFSERKTYLYFKNLYKKKEIKYLDLKEVLAKDLVKKLAPIREKREKLLRQPKDIEEILEEGSKKAQRFAQKTLSEVKEKMGLS